MAEYTPKPSQFRLPAWAQQFLAEESAAKGSTKTDVLLEALECLKQRRLEDDLREGYLEMAEHDLEEAKAWEGTLKDGLDDWTW